MTTKNNRKPNMSKLTKDDIKVQPTKQTPLEQAKEMSAAIDKAIDARNEKLLNARAHLVENLKVTADKYRTANGVMAAIETVRSVTGDSLDFGDEIAIAKGLALEMCARVAKLVETTEKCIVEDLGSICEGLYDEDFASGEASATDLALELMTLNLCQNVGPNAQDIVDFHKTSGEEIDKMNDELEEFAKQHGIDLSELSEA